jgi:UDP-N-acetylmuramoyl-tripeptide--D-alanyl-D-alanine ligase
MEFTLAQVEEATGAQLSGSDSVPAASRELVSTCVRGWSIDSRTVQAGDLFIALRGERFDGHEYVWAALNGGAVGALIESSAGTVGGPVLHVTNTLEALGDLARYARRHWTKPIVAVTGSAGKTSTKEVISALLGTRFRVGKTVGNLNNHIGLPLTLLRIPYEAEVGVVEMGMNHAGEIRELTNMARPQIGVVTNVGYAHIEAFESIEGIAAAKRELIEGLGPDGVAVLNADDARVAAFCAAHRGRSLTYGLSASADVRATEVESGPEGSKFTVDGVRFTTSLYGPHSISNILAGIAVARLFELPLTDLVPAVRDLAPGKMRGERSELRGMTIWNDAYNSNPEAARSMVNLLKAERAERRIAVLGEMLELGTWAEKLHRDLGRYVVESGVDVLIGVRGASRWMVDEARRSGMNCSKALFFEQPEEAGDFLREFSKPGDAILFKGSRGTKVERALARLDQ